ncbi:MAG: RNA polymerase sigma factor [Bellilinea sp.]|jgi:RNA polymerase sigma-70 factor (ECF subfamily)
MDEAEVIAQLKKGNIAALRTLMEMHQVQAVQAAVLITQDRAVAEDIVQNAFLRTYERIEQFHTSRPFRPWFLRVVINDALKAAARHRRHISIDHYEDATYLRLVEQLESTANEPEDVLQRNEVREAIREALTKLSPQQRAAIILRYFLGLSELEMSSKLNCAPGTVKWHLNAARERLRSLLLPFAK